MGGHVPVSRAAVRGAQGPLLLTSIVFLSKNPEDGTSLPPIGTFAVQLIKMSGLACSINWGVSKQILTDIH